MTLLRKLLLRFITYCWRKSTQKFRLVRVWVHMCVCVCVGASVCVHALGCVLVWAVCRYAIDWTGTPPVVYSAAAGVFLVLWDLGTRAVEGLEAKPLATRGAAAALGD